MSWLGFGVAYFRAENVTEAEARRAALWATVIVLGWVVIFCAGWYFAPIQILKDPPSILIAPFVIFLLPMLPGLIVSGSFDVIVNAISGGHGGIVVFSISTTIFLSVNWYFYFRLLANRIHIRAQELRQRTTVAS